MWRHVSITVSLLAAFLLLGCGEKKNPGKATRIEDITTRYNQKKDILTEWAQRVGVEGIKPYLDVKIPPRERATAINALGCLKDNPEATALLVGIAAGDDPNEASFATISLGRQGVPEAKPAIERLMASPTPLLRRSACLAIAEYRDKALYPLLAKAAEDEEVTVRQIAKLMQKRLDLVK